MHNAPSLSVLRSRLGLTQQKLSEVAGISRRTVAGIEAGERPNLLLSSLESLARALSTDTGSVLAAVTESGRVRRPKRKAKRSRKAVRP